MLKLGQMNQVESKDEGDKPSIKKSHGVNHVQRDKDSNEQKSCNNECGRSNGTREYQVTGSIG
jgi:hypothetical protein